MRRCPRCASPCPDGAVACAACGAAPLPGPAGAWAGLRGPGWGRLGGASLPLLVLQLTAGGLLTVGTARREGRFLLFHGLHGLLLGLSLAWLWSERRASRWVGWAFAGLAGGLLAERVEALYTYRHWMGGWVLDLWGWAGMAQDPAVPYRVLQVLRLAAPLMALLIMRWRRSRPDAGGWGRAAVGSLAALALRSRVRGAWVAWSTVAAALGWVHAALYEASVVALLWALGPAVGGPSPPEREGLPPAPAPELRA